MGLVPFLALTLLLPTMIVIGNFVLGILTPTSVPEDDMSMLDSVWRLVQGQHIGTDFHDPLGFGFLQVSAMLWRMLGSHYYVLRASADVFALVIIVCGCLVATRQLRHVAGLAALFCITVAFVASGPSIYGYNQYIGMVRSPSAGFSSNCVIGSLCSITAGGKGSETSLGRCVLIIVFYWGCKVVLNMSNGSRADLTFLAPAAAVVAVTWTEKSETASFWNRLWTRIHLRRLHDVSARQLIPLLIIGMVLVPEAVASLRAVELDYSIWSGTTKSITVSANKGIAFEIPENSRPGLVSYLNRGIHAIESINSSRETIANLDYMNPFPELFLAPSPKGVWVWWNFSRYTNIPVGYTPSWEEVIGDACIVTEPKHSPETPAEYYSEPLIKAVAPHLAIAFNLVYEDELWKIWKRSAGCDTRSGDHPTLASASKIMLQRAEPVSHERDP